MAAPAPDTGAPLGDDDVARLDRLRDAYRRLEAELGRVIIGQRDTIERLAICLFARGHRGNYAVSDRPADGGRRRHSRSISRRKAV